MISVEEARAFVLEACHRLPAQRVPLGQALGLVLAEEVYAPEAVPPFDNSAMDGYALRASSTAGDAGQPRGTAPVAGRGGARLRVVGALMAGGDPRPLVVGEGEAIRVMTGAPLPAGADAVCMVEHTKQASDREVVIEDALAPGANVRRAGEDIAAGDRVFAAGTRLSPAHIGVLASIGVDAVAVHRRPRVGVVSTGDELAQGPGPLAVGKIRDSNRPALLAQLRADGWDALDLGWVGDVAAHLRQVLEQAAHECDAVLTSGGVSVGDRDIVKLVLEEMGQGRALWAQVAVKPAKPFAFSPLAPRGVPAFGLPGNPVSALVSYELFARPALRFMAGYRHLGRPRLSARAEVDLPRHRDGRLHLVRVVATPGPDGTLQARPSGGQGSHQMRALAAANAYALLPDGEGARAGEQVDLLLIDPDALGTPAGL